MENSIVKTEIGNLLPEQLKQLELAGIIPKGTPESQVQVFAQICKEKRLSPFQKQIYLLPFKKKNGEKWETHYACIIGIDGYRTIAERTGKYVGNDDYRFDNGKTEFQLREANKKAPVTATATVYKLVGGQRIPYSATASWQSYCPTDSKKAFNWNRMPFLMLGKTAEALALRKAFPESLSGLHAEEEIGGFEETKDSQEMEDLTKSNDILELYKQKVWDYEYYTELKKDAQKLLSDAVKDGTNAQDTEELAKFSNEFYTKLKNEAETNAKTEKQ